MVKLCLERVKLKKKTKFIVLIFECSYWKLNFEPRQYLVPTLSIGKRQSIAKYNPEVN
jgi:hypothetical protein